MDNATPDEIENAKRQKLRFLARTNFHVFCSLIIRPEDGTPEFCHNRFTRFLVDRLTELERGDFTRGIFNAPPRHGKSTLISRAFPAWCLGRDPTLNIVVATYAEGLALGHSYAVRALVESPMYQWIFPEVRLAGDRKNVKEWFTDKGGRFHAIGVGSGITGKGADLLIIDDPVKDQADAVSDLVRENVWNWWIASARNRLSRRGKVAVLMTRWHPDDLVGRLLHPDRLSEAASLGLPGWRHYNIQAKAQAGDILGRSPGEWLTPERLGELWYLEQMSGSGMWWDAQFQGQPRCAGGNIIDPSCINIVDSWPANLVWTWAYDPACSDKTLADYHALILAAMDPQRNFWVREVHRKQCTWPTFKQHIITQVKRVPGPVVGEGVAGFLGVMQELQLALSGIAPSVHRVTPNTNKVSRAMTWMSHASAKKMFLIRNESNRDYKNEIADFPNGKNDDQVDGTSIAWEAVKYPGNITFAYA